MAQPLERMLFGTYSLSKRALPMNLCNEKNWSQKKKHKVAPLKVTRRSHCVIRLVKKKKVLSASALSIDLNPRNLQQSLTSREIPTRPPSSSRPSALGLDTSTQRALYRQVAKSRTSSESHLASALLPCQFCDVIHSGTRWRVASVLSSVVDVRLLFSLP